MDGKTLRRSFDNFNDRKAAQLLHAFDVEAGLVLAWSARNRGRGLAPSTVARWRSTLRAALTYGAEEYGVTVRSLQPVRGVEVERSPDRASLVGLTAYHQHNAGQPLINRGMTIR